MIWQVSKRTDPPAVAIADRHYNRQKPGTPQFVPPGSCLVFLADKALWVTSAPFPQFVRHAWPGAWVNTLFRNEGAGLSSDLIRQACAATRWSWPAIPEEGMVTFVDASKVRRKRDPGRCYLRAGIRRVGETEGGLIALKLFPEDFPDPVEPLPESGALFAAPIRQIRRPGTV